MLSDCNFYDCDILAGFVSACTRSVKIDFISCLSEGFDVTVASVPTNQIAAFTLTVRQRAVLCKQYSLLEAQFDVLGESFVKILISYYQVTFIVIIVLFLLHIIQQVQ